MFRAPARVTFGRCPKSDQKDSQKPRFLDFLHAVPSANLWPDTSRSQDISVFASLSNCLCICAAAANTNNEQRFGVYRCNCERQRRKTKVDSLYATTISMFRERVA